MISCWQNFCNLTRLQHTNETRESELFFKDVYNFRYPVKVTLSSSRFLFAQQLGKKKMKLGEMKEFGYIIFFIKNKVDISSSIWRCKLKSWRCKKHCPWG